jgi:hypothetical protein
VKANLKKLKKNYSKVLKEAEKQYVYHPPLVLGVIGWSQELLRVSKMNGITRKRFYIFLVKRDGENCKHCDKSPPKVNLVIDHIDNNNGNNSSGNLQLLCRRCNYLKNPRRPVDLSEREEEDETELQKSRRIRPLIKKFILHEINENGVVSEKDLQNGGAELHSCSQQTVQRVIDSICSPYGILERVKSSGGYFIRYKDAFYDI